MRSWLAVVLLVIFGCRFVKTENGTKTNFVLNSAEIEIESLFFPDSVAIHRESVDQFRTGETRKIAITLQSDEPYVGNLTIQCDDDTMCTVLSPVGENVYVLDEGNNFTKVIDVVVEAKFLGLPNLEIVAQNVSIYKYQLRILRSNFEYKLAQAFTVVVTVFILFVTFLMGTQLKMNAIFDIMKEPIGPAIGFCCQFLLMPLVAYTLSKTILPSNELALQFSLFAAGCSPGGGKSSFWTIIFGGNLDLSVSMTLTQTIGAMFMMPIWIYTLGRTYFTERISVPFNNIAESLATLLIPSLAGMIFIHYQAHLMDKCQKWIKVATWVATVVFTVFGCYTNFYVFYLMTWRIVLVACIHPWIGYILAYLVAWLCRRNHIDRLTIAIETGVQNVGIAIIMLMFSLPEPEVDLALVLPIAIILTTDKPLLIMYFSRAIYRKWCKASKKETSQYAHNITISGDLNPSNPVENNKNFKI
uniref:Ileal sodium/bile acid cotransporter n=1 Tax=Panagrellus redivivus TaxID=6233 RepID=A0A7E4VVR5_PANRE